MFRIPATFYCLDSVRILPILVMGLDNSNMRSADFVHYRMWPYRSTVNPYARDFALLIPTGLQFVMFGSGIFYYYTDIPEKYHTLF